MYRNKFVYSNIYKAIFIKQIILIFFHHPQRPENQKAFNCSEEMNRKMRLQLIAHFVFRILFRKFQTFVISQQTLCNKLLPLFPE